MFDKLEKLQCLADQKNWWWGSEANIGWSMTTRLALCASVLSTSTQKIFGFECV